MSKTDPRKSLPNLFGGALSKNVSEGRLVRDGERGVHCSRASASATPPPYPRSLPALESPERPLNPFVRGKQEYAERYGSLVGEARLWRLGCLVLLFGFGGLSVHQQQTNAQLSEIVRKSPRAELFVVQKCGGAVVAAGPATKAKEPDAEIIAWTVEDWIEDLRTVSVDRQTQTTLGDRVFARLSEKTPAHQKIKQWYAEHDPYSVAGRSVEVEVFPPQFVGSAKQLKVNWVERERDGRSNQVKESHFSGFVTIAISRSSKKEDREKNMLGIYVTDVSLPSRVGGS